MVVRDRNRGRRADHAPEEQVDSVARPPEGLEQQRHVIYLIALRIRTTSRTQAMPMVFMRDEEPR